MSDAPQAPDEPITLKLSGDFSFARNADFRDLMARYPRGERAFVLDLSEVEHVDNSALGLLLKLRDHSLGGRSLTLLNPNQEMRTALAESELLSVLTVEEG